MGIRGSRRAFGLPGGGVGAKVRGYYIQGNADAATGRPRKDVSKLSKACAKAYTTGYDRGLEGKT